MYPSGKKYNQYKYTVLLKPSLPSQQVGRAKALQKEVTFWSLCMNKTLMIKMKTSQEEEAT